MLVILYYIIDLIFLITLLVKYKKFGNKDYWIRFITLFSTNFILSFIDFYYYSNPELDLGWNLLLIWFRVGLFLIINIIIGIIGGNINFKNKKDLEEDFTESTSRYIKKFKKYVIIFLHIIIPFIIVFNIQIITSKEDYKENKVIENTKKYLTTKYGNECKFYPKEVSKEYFDQGFTTYTRYKVLVSSSCTDNYFLVYSVDGLKPSYDYFLDMYYYNYFNFNSSYYDEYGDVYYNLEQKENEEAIKDFNILNDKLEEEREKLDKYLDKYINVKIEDQRSVYASVDSLYSFLPKDYGKIPTKEEFFELLYEEKIQDFYFEIDESVIEFKLKNLQDAKKALDDINKENKSNYKMSGLSIYKGHKKVIEYDTEEKLLDNMINDINRKYGTIHPEIKSKLIKNYKILAKALGDYFPKGDTKEFDCYYGSRYNSSYSNYNVNIEISNDIYINHELNNKKQTIKISRNQ